MLTQSNLVELIFIQKPLYIQYFEQYIYTQRHINYGLKKVYRIFLRQVQQPLFVFVNFLFLPTVFFPSARPLPMPS